MGTMKDYEPCGETVYGLISWGDPDIYPSCALPERHIGKHDTWYNPPQEANPSTFSSENTSNKKGR